MVAMKDRGLHSWDVNETWMTYTLEKKQFASWKITIDIRVKSSTKWAFPTIAMLNYHVETYHENAGI